MFGESVERCIRKAANDKILVRPRGSLPLRLGLKLSFLIKLIVRDGSGDPETCHSLAAIGLDC